MSEKNAQQVKMLPKDGHNAVPPELEPPAATAEIVKAEPVVLVAPTTMGLIQQAIHQGAGIETLRELFTLKREVEADEARKAFNQAFAAFKAEAVHIVKNVTYKDGPLKGKKHADLFAVVDAATPALSKHDLSMAWKLTKDEKDWLEVTCVLRHELGHSESVSMGSGPDTGPARNAIQARASAKTYLERYTALSILGMAAEDMDDDGAATAEWEPLKNCLEAIKTAPDFSALEMVYKAAFKNAKAEKREDAMRALITAKDERKAELSREPRMKFPPNYYPNVEQNSVEWLTLRVGSVTASRIADVALKQKNGKYYAARKDYMVDLLAETLTGRATDHNVSVPMMFGVENEKLAVANYEFDRGIDTEKIGYITHPTIQRAGASPDRLVGDDGLLECKVPNTTTHLEYFEAGIVPEDYIPQMAWQLACSGRKWCDFCSYDPRLPEEFGLFIVRYQRDDAFIALMEEEVLKFRAELEAMAERLLKRKGEHLAKISSLPEEAPADSGVPPAVLPEWVEIPR